MHLRVLRDEVIEVHPHRLVRGVAEQPLRGWVPQTDFVRGVHHDDRGRAGLDQRLEEPALAHEFAHILVQRERADERPVHRDRHRPDRDVDERPVLPAPARQDFGWSEEDTVVHRGRMIPDRFMPTHQVVDVGPQCLRPGPAEQSLGGWVPGRDDELRIARDDGRGARFDQRLEISTLAFRRLERPLACCSHRVKRRTPTCRELDGLPLASVRGPRHAVGRGHELPLPFQIHQREVGREQAPR